jgi:chemosensory pili system protein ChpA (sensor histidine kinase/response regulator)
MSPPGGPLVLIVDDDADTREMCATLLDLAGFRTAEATNGVEALAMAQALAPDCILMDLSLPALDGWGATRQLKADEHTRGIPVIAVSGLSFGEGVSHASEEGFAAVVTKPYTPEAVLCAIRLALDRG